MCVCFSPLTRTRLHSCDSKAMMVGGHVWSQAEQSLVCKKHLWRWSFLLECVFLWDTSTNTCVTLAEESMNTNVNKQQVNAMCELCNRFDTLASTNVEPFVVGKVCKDLV
eukprot:m.144400 g.144400  ORF g.144400 m.144400 type:complete len:110 (-) comp14127_c0_seq1:2957-3286(-)